MGGCMSQPANNNGFPESTTASGTQSRAEQSALQSAAGGNHSPPHPPQGVAPPTAVAGTASRAVATAATHTPPAIRPPVVLPSETHFTPSINARNGYNYEHVYDIDAELGRGAFGSVYKGRHREAATSNRSRKGDPADDDGGMTQHWKHVAIKKTRPNQLDLRGGRQTINTPDDLEQRCQEIKTLIRLREGNPLTSTVLFLYEYFMSGRDVYMVTEILQQELDEYRTECDMFTEHDAIEICRTILNGMEFLKSRNVVHRDLKLQNILFRVNGVFSSLKIVDFGLARVLEEGESSKDFCGSIGYISPEIYQGKSYKHEVDMFCFGVLLFRLLSGERPFQSNNSGILKRHTVDLRYNVNGTDWEGVSGAAKDLIRKLLINRQERLTVEQALEHPWFLEEGASVLRGDLSHAADASRSIAFLRSRAPTALSRGDGGRFWIDASAQIAMARIQLLGIYEWRMIDQTPPAEDGTGGLICVEESPSPVCVSIPEYVSQLQSYTEKECRHLCIQLARCIECLHGDEENRESRVAHRNLHMENIIVDPQGNLSLKGLQHSQLIRDNQPLTGHFGYLYSWYAFKAPEVDSEFVHDKAVDLWSLGAIIYMLLTGLPPFRGTGMDLIQSKHVGLVDFDIVIPSGPAQRLVRGLLKVQPEERFTIDDVLNSQWMIEADEYLETCDLSLAHIGLQDWRNV